MRSSPRTSAQPTCHFRSLWLAFGLKEPISVRLLWNGYPITSCVRIEIVTHEVFSANWGFIIIIHLIHDILCSNSIEETPKEIVRSDLVCFLFSMCMSSEQRLNVPVLMIESSIDIDAAVFSSSDLFICTAGYKKLIPFEKIASNLRTLQRN